jgi:cytochrome c peroxidase
MGPVLVMQVPPAAGVLSKTGRPVPKAALASLLLVVLAWSLLVLVPAPALAQPMPPSPLRAPAQDFVAPAPGSYALPVIQAAADGWVLEGSQLPRRLSRYTQGAITLLSFVYTYCSDPVGCPLAYATFDTVKRRVVADPALRGRVRLVSLSFDPGNDTPDAMRVYGGEHARSTALPWHFLTTYSTKFLKPILDDFGQDVDIELDPQGRPTRARTHLLKVFLLDAKGQVREIYSTAFLHVDVIVNDIKTLALETATGAPLVRQGVGEWRGWTAADQTLHSATALGLPPLPVPTDVVLDPKRIELGRKLFFDRRLSFNGTMSCAMCHVPEQGFTSHASKTALGIEGKSLKRNAPSLLNVAWQAQQLFHDGRETKLSSQAWLPLLNAEEMANPSVGHVLQRLRALPDYANLFERAFVGAGPTKASVGAAIAAFEASLVAADSRFDRWRFGGQRDALSAEEQQGFLIFSGKGQCTRCHLVGERHALFADAQFHVTGVGFKSAAVPRANSFVVPLAPGVQTVMTDADLSAFANPNAADLGRFDITLAPADRYAFRTPSLRNVAQTAPYMHDGSLATLGDVVDFYDRGAGAAPNKSALLTALGLAASEKRALVAFLRSLDGSNLSALATDSRPAPPP